MVYFDDVKIPWERVFVHNSTQMSADVWHAIPVHVMHNYPGQVRLMVKMRLFRDGAHATALSAVHPASA